jgi:transcriptional regulator with XRE-family HTH domain
VSESRLERFRLAHGIERRELINRAGISRVTYHDLRKGNDTHLSTIRAVVRAASAILGRPVKATELFDLGASTPSGTITLPRKVVPLRQRGSLKRFETTLDRILRREQILHSDFAAHVGVSRQTLLRYRSGQLEPSLVTLVRMVETLRGMTGKPYQAKHLYDVGEEGA